MMAMLEMEFVTRYDKDGAETMEMRLRLGLLEMAIRLSAHQRLELMECLAKGRNHAAFEVKFACPPLVQDKGRYFELTPEKLQAKGGL